jgi:hypothetical protein
MPSQTVLRALETSFLERSISRPVEMLLGPRINSNGALIEVYETSSLANLASNYCSLGAVVLLLQVAIPYPLVSCSLPEWFLSIGEE